jgi:hypothetical protein
MEKRIGDSELWVAMVSSGIFNGDKLKDLKVKAWRMIGKSEYSRKNYEEAKKALQSALALVGPGKFQKELADLLADASKKQAVEDKKEKSVWQKAFKKGSAGAGDLYTTENDLSEKGSTPKSSPAKKPSIKQLQPKNDFQVAKTDGFFSQMFGSMVFMGVIGLLGGAAYWWTRRRR